MARYLVTLLAVMLVTSAAVWVWVATVPLAFLDPEYPAWLAKRQMLDRCDLGDVIVVGDSRAAVDIMPGLVPVRTTNLAVGGGSPIEAYFAVARALRCPHPPGLVIVSLDAGHFIEPDLFWERTVRFGFVGRAELADLRDASRRLDDPTYYGAPRADGLSAAVRAALYGVRFPSLYFNSLVKSGVFLRWWQNEATLAAGLAARGQYFFGTDPGSGVVAAEGHLRAFAALPVLDDYFDRMLALLDAHGVAVDFVAMPMNEATWQAVQPAVRDGFAAYLASYADRYSRFRVVGDVMPHWANRWFGDGYAHLNPDGARRFSTAFGTWLGVALSPAAGGPAQHTEGGTIGMVQ